MNYIVEMIWNRRKTDFRECELCRNEIKDDMYRMNLYINEERTRNILTICGDCYSKIDEDNE